MLTEEWPASQNCGVPEEVFAPGFKGIVESPSGLPLSCQVTERRVRIEDMTYRASERNPYFVFDASVDTQQGADSPQLSFLVRTHHENARPSRHPDLHAAALLGRSIRYLDAIEPLTSLKARWSGETQSNRTNFDQFRRVLDTHPGTKEEAEKLAAFSTWTGRQALRHGFTDIGWIKYKSYYNFDVLFRRPGA